MAFSQAFRESTTLKLVIPCWLAVLGKYLVSGYDFGLGVSPGMGAVEFGTAQAAILGIWLVRETKEAYREKWKGAT